MVSNLLVVLCGDRDAQPVVNAGRSTRSGRGRWPPTQALPAAARPAVHDGAARWADDDLRSVNAQIEFLLTESARQAGRLQRGSEPRPDDDDDDPDER